MATSRSSETAPVLRWPFADADAMSCQFEILLPAEGLDTADADEAAAVLAVLSMWLEEDQRAEASDDTNESAWTRAAKLESQGVAVGPATLPGGWRLSLRVYTSPHSK